MGIIRESTLQSLRRRIRACDYLTVAQLFLQSNFLLENPLTSDDIKPRLLGHWGTCHGINVAYANFRQFFAQNPNFSFVLGPGHGFPALQANLFLDGELAKVDQKAAPTTEGIAYICRHFSWPGGFPSHASPFTPGVICEGGELGYCLGAAYGYVLGRPERTIAVMLGDGELETATALASLNLVKLLGDHSANGRVWPILHLNGYKISAPTLYARKSERELNELIRGFGYTPIWIKSDNPATFQTALHHAVTPPPTVHSKKPQPVEHPFFILETEKGATGPREVNDKKVAGNFLAHQIPLPNAKTDPTELEILQNWLESYHFAELFDPKKGFML